jgi:hypothetical protein
MIRKLMYPFGAIVCCASIGWIAVQAQETQDPARVPYPAGYRSWPVVKSTLVGPQSRLYAVRGGFHHFYANPQAMEGYRTGTFPDGALIVDEGVYAVESDGVTREGERRSVEVMHKDRSVYKTTDGWGFERFEAENQVGSASLEARTACHKCHQTKRDKDYVFSVFRK